MQTRSILRPLAATRPSFHTSGLAGPSGAVPTRLDGLIDHIQLRMRLAGAALRFRVAALATTPRVLFSVLRGRTEPTIPANTDFGRLHTQPDYSVVTAGSPEELKAHLAYAYAHDLPITIAGSRHSSNGQTLPRAAGRQIQLDRSSGGWPGPRLLADGRVQISAAHTWKVLHDFLKTHGLAVPVLTDHLGTSIGGTLSVGGGIGTGSVAYGRQLDGVERFSLILPDGREVWCSPDANAELFRHALGGMGELGVINEVVMRTRAPGPHLATFCFQAESLAEAGRMIQSVLTHPARPTNLTHLVFEGPILGTPYIHFEIGLEFDDLSAAEAMLSGERPAALAALAAHERHARVIDSDQSNARSSRSSVYVASLDGHKHLWNDYFFNDFSSYERFLQRVEEEVLSVHGHEYLMSGLGFAYPSDALDPVRADHRRAAFSYPNGPAEAYRWSFGFNYSVPPGPEVEKTKDALRKIAAIARQLGAGLYGYGYNERTTEDMRATYGDIVDTFIRLKHEVDPKGLLGGSLPLA